MKDEETQCDRWDIRTHRWQLWSIYFMRCLDCGEYAPRDTFQQKAAEAEEHDRLEAQWGR